MIRISGKFSKSSILRLLEEKIDKICSGEIHEVNKMKVKLKRFDRMDFNMDNKNIIIDVPLEFKLLKGEGIFAVEVSGRVTMDIQAAYNIDSQMNIDLNTELISRKWLEGPIVEIGSLDLPVEKVADLVMDYYKEEMLNSISETLESNINNVKHSLLEVRKIKDLVTPYLPEGLYLDFNKIEIFAQEPCLNEETLCIDLLVHPNLNVSTYQTKSENPYLQLSFQWVEKIQEQTLGYIKGELTYEFVLKILKNLINDMELGDEKIYVSQLSHQIMNDVIILTGQLLSPFEGKLRFELSPIFNESRGELTLKRFESDIQPKSFIYKMGAPVLNKIIEEKINNIFPWLINKLLAEKATKFNGFKKEWGYLLSTTYLKWLSVDELLFGKESIAVKLRYEDLKIDLHENAKQS